MTSLYHSLNSSSFRMECDLQRGIAIISLRWRLRFFRELVPAEEARHIDDVHVRVTSGTDFLIRRDSGRDGRGADWGQDRRRERRTRGWSGWRHRFLSGPQECEEQGCGDNGEGEEACEHRHAARHSHTTAGRPVRATRFSLLNVSAVESHTEVRERV